MIMSKYKKEIHKKIKKIKQYIMENGMLIIMYDTEEEFKYGKMVLNM